MTLANLIAAHPEPPSLALPYPLALGRAGPRPAADLPQRLPVPERRGVMLLDLIDADRQQLSLLDTPQSDAEQQRGQKLMNVMDELNGRMGHEAGHP